MSPDGSALRFVPARYLKAWRWRVQRRSQQQHKHPRWTLENRPSIDGSKPATTGLGRPRRLVVDRHGIRWSSVLALSAHHSTGCRRTAVVMRDHRRTLNVREAQGCADLATTRAPRCRIYWRTAGKKASGYHRQARVGNAFSRYKSIIGDGLRTRSGGSRSLEASLACTVLNRI